MNRPAGRAPTVDVLLVEDDVVLTTLLVEALRARHVTIDVAGDVAEAKRLLSTTIYKVAIIDMLLDGGTGFEVIDFIKNGGAPRMNAVVITAAEPAALRELDRSIVKTVFFKPLQLENVVGYVQKLAN